MSLETARELLAEVQRDHDVAQGHLETAEQRAAGARSAAADHTAAAEHHDRRAAATWWGLPNPRRAHHQAQAAVERAAAAEAAEQAEAHEAAVRAARVNEAAAADRLRAAEDAETAARHEQEAAREEHDPDEIDASAEAIDHVQARVESGELDYADAYYASGAIRPDVWDEALAQVAPHLAADDPVTGRAEYIEPDIGNPWGSGAQYSEPIGPLPVEAEQAAPALPEPQAERGGGGAELEI
jgi:hypothetical protein